MVPPGHSNGDPRWLWLLILLLVITYKVISYPFALLEIAVSDLAGRLCRMGRAKEKILARNKIKSDKKAAKIEDRERQRQEEVRQAAELRLVQEQQNEVDRDKQKRRRTKYLLREAEVKATAKSARCHLIKDSIAVPPNPNHGYVQKPIWKDVQESREAILLEREREQAHQARSALGHDEGPISTFPLTLDNFLRQEEIKTVAEFFNDEALKDSTLNGIRLNEVTPAVAAVALCRFDLIKRLFKDDQYVQDYSNKWVTPLGCAVISKNWDMIDFILEKDVDHAHDVDKFGNTPLIQAALTSAWKSYDMANLWHILKADTRTDIRTANKVGLTFVHALAWRGWHEVLDEVLPLNPILDEQKQELWLLVNAAMCDGALPLHFAVSKGHASAAQLLIARGSVVHEEDKTGCTPLCRAISEMYGNGLSGDDEIGGFISPVCEVIVTALNNPLCPTDIRNYALRRLYLVMNPSLDEQGFLDAFYRVGRTVFSFVVRYIQNGLDLLLELRLFNKLITSGKKHMHNPDYVVTICGILFDVLVYAENVKSDYGRVCSSFVNEGGADFCLRLMQRAIEDSTAFSNSRSAASASISSVSVAGDWVTGCFGIAAGDVAQAIEKNIAISALMPIIQVIDCAEMKLWFTTHFLELKSAYLACEERDGAEIVFSCDLDEGLMIRTRKKVIIFEMMLSRSAWSRPQDILLLYLRNSGPIAIAETEIEKMDDSVAERVESNESVPSTTESTLSKGARKKKAKRERLAVERAKLAAATKY